MKIKTMKGETWGEIEDTFENLQAKNELGVSVQFEDPYEIRPTKLNGNDICEFIYKNFKEEFYLVETECEDPFYYNKYELVIKEDMYKGMLINLKNNS